MDTPDTEYYPWNRILGKTPTDLQSLIEELHQEHDTSTILKPNYEKMLKDVTEQDLDFRNSTASLIQENDIRLLQSNERLLQSKPVLDPIEGHAAFGIDEVTSEERVVGGLIGAPFDVKVDNFFDEVNDADDVHYDIAHLSDGPQTQKNEFTTVTYLDGCM